MPSVPLDPLIIAGIMGRYRNSGPLDNTLRLTANTQCLVPSLKTIPFILITLFKNLKQDLLWLG